jgi:hypothetical protein
MSLIGVNEILYLLFAGCNFASLIEEGKEGKEGNRQ